MKHAGRGDRHGGPASAAVPRGGRRLARAAGMACALAVAAARAGAQGAGPVPPPTAAMAASGATPILAVPLAPGERLVLDGSLAHPAWQRAPVHDQFVERFPDNGAAPRRRTEVRVLFDRLALYIGVRAHDPRPEEIRAPLVRHDGVNRTQDFVAVYLDAIGNRHSAQFFRVNAAGSTADGMHTAADDNEDFSPDFDFDAAARRDALGWTAVLRIPFASLRFADNAAGAGPAAWRILVLRRTPREQFSADTSTLVPRDAPSSIATMQPLAGVVLPEHAQFLSLRPSLTLRQSTQQSGTEPSRRERKLEGSLDLKWRPRPELVVDATLHPDFSQVALDVPQLAGNTRYALSLAEKRPFFFESSDLLRTPTDALYTRSFTEPGAGLRATWRGPGLAGTVLAIADKGGASVLLPGAYGTGYADQPGSRAVAARLLAERAGLQWGGLLALRRYDDGRGDNTVGGPDMAWQFDDALRLRAQWLWSSTTAQPMADGMLAAGERRDGRRAVLKLNYQTPGFEAEGSYDESSAGFRHDTGFVNQAGVRSGWGRLGWGWQGDAVRPFNDFWVNLEAQSTGEPASGRLVARDVWPNLWFTGPHNLEGWLHWHGLSVLRTAADQPLLAERYWKAGLVVTPARWLPLMTARLQWGRLADVTANRVRPGATGSLTLSTRPLAWLELEPSLWRAWLGEGGRRYYDESATQLLAVAHVDARQSLRAIVQRTRYGREAEPGIAADHEGGTTGSLTYAWRRTAGSVLYVGASRERQGFLGATQAPARGTEFFVKLQVDVDDVRQRFGF